jgi:chromosome segregation ATPase
MKPTPDYGEPWRKETYNTPMGETGDYEGHLEIWAGERRVADCWNPDDENEEDFDRIIACVNACVGLADPAKEIAELRDEVAAANASSEMELVRETQEQNIVLLEQVSRLIREKHELRAANTAIQEREAALVASKDLISKRAEDIRCELVKVERERDELLQALSGRTVSCEQCNEAGYKLAGFEAEVAGLRAEISEAKEVLQQIDLPDESLATQVKRYVDQHDWQVGINRGQAAQIEQANWTVSAMREAIREVRDFISRLRPSLLSLEHDDYVVRYGVSQEYATSEEAINERLTKLQPFITPKP